MVAATQKLDVIARRGATPLDVAISSWIFRRTYRRLPRRAGYAHPPRNDIQMGRKKSRLLLAAGIGFYRTKEVDRVVDQLSPGSRMAAAGLAFQSGLSPSALGMVCQGSMQMNLGSPGLDQIRV